MADLSLRDAAEMLEVHYMTAYRYVRNGRLPAHKVGSEWRVRVDDLRALSAQADAVRRGDAPSGQASTKEGGAPKAASTTATRRSRDPRRLVARLVVADEPGAWGVIEQAMSSGAEPADVLLDMVSPAMVDIGERWERGELSVADEHRASAVAHRIIGRLGPRFARRGRKRGTVVLGAVPGDHHGLPVAILSDLLRNDGFEAIDLGADTPAESFVDAATTAERLIAVGLSATSTEVLATVPDVVAALHAASPSTPIVLGGYAVRDARHAAELGADRWAAGGREAVAVFDDLASGRSDDSR